jgi:hypothetical protein
MMESINIILSPIQEKQLNFGAAGMSDFTIHKDEQRRQRYINRHKNSNENWSNLA